MANHNQTTGTAVNIRSIEPLCEPSFLPLAHQVSGQTNPIFKRKKEFLQSRDGRVVLKPCGNEDQNEHSFYKRLFGANQSCLNQDEKDLVHFLPLYRGPLVNNEVSYIAIENITAGIRYPSILELKVGVKAFEQELQLETTEEVNAKTNFKSLNLADVGFQLSGMKIFDKSDLTYYYYDKQFGLSLNLTDTVHAIAIFFQCHQLLQTNKIEQTLFTLEQMQRWFESQTTYHFYGTSLVLAYDSNSEPAVCSVRVKLVDFGHVCPARDNKRDENFLYGLIRLIECLRLLLSPEYFFVDVR